MNKTKRTRILHGILAGMKKPRQREEFIGWAKTATSREIRRQAHLAGVSCSPPISGKRRTRKRPVGTTKPLAWWKRIYASFGVPKESVLKKIRTQLVRQPMKSERSLP